ncbi:hypothetical protein [Aquimarina spongiae]|uniref:Capsule assembly protein Wzi n=1 Tax=Aquimarina spongiae TaxID=570521 RepID=A0A1M6DT33_9FLAO|nr:hypothetical protein [Aquimarina spongiae]SHI76417.1 hypothetical protein SAMN04488508_1035 [Aquimarina spongiae]
MDSSKLIVLLSLFGLLATTSRAQDLSKLGDSTAVQFSGSVGARTIFYSAKGGPERRQPFTYLLTGNAAVSIYDFNIPFNFTFANQQFQFSQPFNQIGASPSYKWVRAHLGHRNIVLSQFTLAGHQMFGAGVEVTPGKFRASIMYGRLQRAVPEDTTLVSLRRPAYERRGMGAKIGYGTGTDFIDLIVFKAEDDENSLDTEESPQTITPGENLVIGLNTRKTFFKKKLSFYFDGALSAFTLDKTLSVAIPKVDFLDNLASGFITTNASTQMYTAFKTGIRYQGKTFGLLTQAQRIDADYRSMGLYFINNDVLAYSINPSFIIWKRKIRINGGITFQRDNLNNKKIATSKRTIPTVNIVVAPSPSLNFTGSYTNLTTLMEEGVIPLDNAFKQDQKNPIYTVTANYIKSDTIRSHSISLFGSRSELKDGNPLTQQFSEYVGNSINTTYNFTQMQQHYGVYVSYNYNDLQTFTGKLPGNGFSIGGNKSFFDQKWNISSAFSYAKQQENESQSFVLSSSYQLKKHQISLSANYLKTELITGPFDEFTGFINYVLRF